MSLRVTNLSGYFPETRILFHQGRWPLAKALLRLGETLVEERRIRRPLDFYHVLVNGWVGRQAQSAIWGLPPARAIVCDICSDTVRGISGAVAFAYGGISIEPGINANLLFLVASPTHATSTFQRILRDLKRILRNRRRLTSIAECTTPGDVQALLELCAIECEAALPER